MKLGSLFQQVYDTKVKPKKHKEKVLLVSKLTRKRENATSKGAGKHKKKEQVSIHHITINQ